MAHRGLCGSRWHAAFAQIRSEGMPHSMNINRPTACRAVVLNSRVPGSDVDGKPVIVGVNAYIRK